MKKGKKALVISLVVIAIVAVSVPSAFFLYVSNPYAADEYAISKCKSDALVDYSKQGNDHVFAPKTAASRGLILYPGAKVEDRSYAPLANELASRGVFTVVCHMKFNLAFFSRDAASNVITNYPDIDFFLGGHSLGGVVASMYAVKNSSSISGLIYLASYSSKDLKPTNLPSLSIVGSNDKVLKWESYEKSKGNQPHMSEYVIEGGNHSGFGSYGLQQGDGESSLAQGEQAAIAAEKIASYILSK